jgi:RNA polymerase sigma factor (sigma-70 family)
LILARRIAARIVGPSQADDIASEATFRLLGAWRRAHSHPEAWLARVATNLAIDEYRLQKRGRRQPPAIGTTPSHEDAILTKIVAEELLQRLPKRQREVLVLRYLCDLSDRDIGSLLAVAEGTVRKHRERAMRRLQIEWKAG